MSQTRYTIRVLSCPRAGRTAWMRGGWMTLKYRPGRDSAAARFGTCVAVVAAVTCAVVAFRMPILGPPPLSDAQSQRIIITASVDCGAPAFERMHLRNGCFDLSTGHTLLAIFAADDQSLVQLRSELDACRSPNTNVTLTKLRTQQSGVPDRLPSDFFPNLPAWWDIDAHQPISTYDLLGETAPGASYRYSVCISQRDRLVYLSGWRP
jgi:hypothetical protein